MAEASVRFSRSSAAGFSLLGSVTHSSQMYVQWSGDSMRDRAARCDFPQKVQLLSLPTLTICMASFRVHSKPI